jgi:hypothetical protein
MNDLTVAVSVPITFVSPFTFNLYGLIVVVPIPTPVEFILTAAELAM